MIPGQAGSVIPFTRAASPASWAGVEIRYSDASGSYQEISTVPSHTSPAAPASGAGSRVRINSRARHKLMIRFMVQSPVMA